MKEREKDITGYQYLSHPKGHKLGRGLKIWLMSLLVLWWGTDAKAQTLINTTKQELSQTISDEKQKLCSDDTTGLYKVFSKDEDTKAEIGKVCSDEVKDTLDKEDDKAKDKENESPTKFSIETWVWYWFWWTAFRWTRLLWSGKLFKDSKWETSIYSCFDLDDPLHSKWSWKVVLWKSIYKWMSLEWDYTFTWTWDNVARFGIWYEWKSWDGKYKVKLFPLNTNWSPISAQVSIWTKVWKDWRFDLFVFVDFGKHSYYSETEYVHKLAKWIAAFIELRLWWKLDGKFKSDDSQTLLWWIKVDIK